MGGQVKLRSQGLDWRLVEGEVVALDVDRSVYLSVNPTGAVLWPLLAEGAAPEALRARLRDACALDEGRAARDVDAFVADLRAQGLLEP